MSREQFRPDDGATPQKIGDGMRPVYTRGRPSIPERRIQDPIVRSPLTRSTYA